MPWARGLAEACDLPLTGSGGGIRGCLRRTRSTWCRETGISPGFSTRPAPRESPRGCGSPMACWPRRRLCYPVDVDPVRSGGRRALRSADEPWRRHLRADPRAHGRAHIVPVSGGFDAARCWTCRKAWRDVDVHGAHDGPPADRCGEGDRSQGRWDQDHRLWRRADVSRRYRGGGRTGSDRKFVQIYGQGECPMAITALSREEVADRTHPRWARAAGLRRAGAVAGRGRDFGRAGRTRCPPGETGEIMVRGAP
jgi:long-chain acyl-CoA synthetase